jgi:hypothetical protein
MKQHQFRETFRDKKFPEMQPKDGYEELDKVIAQTLINEELTNKSRISA